MHLHNILTEHDQKYHVSGPLIVCTQREKCVIMKTLQLKCLPLRNCSSPGTAVATQQAGERCVMRTLGILISF